VSGTFLRPFAFIAGCVTQFLFYFCPILAYPAEASVRLVRA